MGTDDFTSWPTINVGDEIKTSLIVGSSFGLFEYLMQRSKISLLANLSVTSSAIME